jgi:hypothetical protein
MRPFARVAVAFAALASFFGVLTSAAHAVTWHNSGSTSFTATAGPGTFSSTGVNLTCTSSRSVGTAAATSVGAVYQVTGTATASGCQLAGLSYYAHCTYTLTAVAQTSPSVTTGSTDQVCTLKLAANNVAVCGVDGSTPGSYTNPSGATPGRITAFTSTTLRLTNVSPNTCPLGNGDPGALTHKTGTISGGIPTTLGPLITRTA